MADDVKFRVGADTNPAKDELKKLEQEVKKTEVNVEIDVDTKKVKKEIDELGREIEKKVPKVEIEVAADTEQAERGIKNLKDETEKKPMRASVALELENIRAFEKELDLLKQKAEQVIINPNLGTKEKIAEITKEIEEMSRKAEQFNFDPRVLELFKNQLTDLKKEIEYIPIKLQLEREKILEQQLQDIRTKVDEIKIKPENFSKEEIRAVKKELIEIATKAEAIHFGDPNKAKAITDETKEMAKSLASSKDEADGLDKQFSMIKLTVAHLATDLVKNILGSLKKATIEGSKLNKELETGIEKIKTISNANSGTLNYEVMGISKNFGIDPREVSEGLYQVITSVGDVAEKFEFLETSAKLAKTGFLEINDAVDGLSTVINAYGMSMDKAADVANVFVKTQKVGKTTVKEFSDSLSRMVPIAKELNVSIEELGASTALLTAKGTTSRMAGTQISSFLYEVQNANSRVNQMFQQAAGLSADEFFKNGGSLEKYIRLLKEYQELSGKDVVSSLGNKNSKNFYLAMAGDLETYNTKLKEISTNTGELDKNTQAMMSTFESRMDRASQYANQFKISMGEAYNTVVAKIGDLITGYDAESAAQLKVNNSTSKNIETITELTKKMEGQYDMSKLTTGEQDELNKALNSTLTLAPNLYEAFISWKNGVGSYANMLGIATQKQREFLALNAMIGLGENRKQLADIQNEKAKNTIKGFDLLGGQAYAKGYNSLEQIRKDPELWAQIKKDPQKLEKFQNIQATDYGLNIKETAKKNEVEIGEKGLQQKDVEVTTGAALDLNKKIVDLGNIITGNTEATEANTKNDEIKTVRNEEEIKLEYKKNENELNKQLVNAAGKAKDDITKELKSNNTKKEIALLENKLTELDNANRNAQTSEDYNLKRDMILADIEGKKNELLLIEQDTGRSGGGGGGRSKKSNADKDAAKAFRESEQEINNDYLSKHNQLTEQYNNEMNAAIAANNQKAIEKLTEEYNKAIKKLDTDKKIELNSFKAENAPNLTKAERESLELQNQQLKLQQEQLENEDKNKALQKQMNENMQNLNIAMENLGSIMTSLANANTGTAAGNTLNQVLGIGGSILQGLDKVGALKGLLSGGGTLSTLLGGASKLFGNINKGTGVGNIISGIMGGGTEGNLGSTLGSVAGGLFGGGVGSVLGGALGSVVGSLFGSKKKKKQERELKNYKKAQEALEKAQKYAASDWSLYAEDYAEQLQRRGAADYISMYDKLLNVRSLSQVMGTLEGNQLKGSSKFTSEGSAYGIKMESLRELMPQYTDKEIMDWFASVTGGAVMNGEYLETGQGKYGVFDLEKLAEEISKINTEFAAELKQQIKEIINFTAENIASVVSDGFGEGLEDLGDNLEKQIAESLKSAFLNTQVFKDLSNGFSDLMSSYITDMFKNDPNLGIDMSAEGLNSPIDYINALKQYAEYATELQKEIFDELGLNINNLTGSIDSLNSNLSANTVQGLATNLFKYNAGQDPGAQFSNEITINVMIDEDAIKKQTIKYVTDSMSKQRRGGYS